MISMKKSLVERVRVPDNETLKRKERLSKRAVFLIRFKDYGLSKDHKRVIYLRTVEGMSLRECGREMKYSHEKIRYLEFEAISKLKRSSPGIGQKWRYLMNVRRKFLKTVERVDEEKIYARELILNAITQTELTSVEEYTLFRRTLGDFLSHISTETGKHYASHNYPLNRALELIMEKFPILDLDLVNKAGFWGDPRKIAGKRRECARDYHARHRNGLKNQI